MTPTTRRRAAICLALLVIASASAIAEDRFPRPDFETDYTRPTPEKPQPRQKPRSQWKKR